MVEIRQRSVAMSHGGTFYFEAGAGHPLILLHGAGFLSGRHNWLRVMPALGEHFHVFAIDCLGFGPGDQLAQPYSFAYLVDHVREFQDVMGLTSSHVVGHSMGGWLGALLAYESSNRVDRFVDSNGGGVATRQLQSMVNWEPPSDETVKTTVTKLAGENEFTQDLIDERMRLAHDQKVAAGFRRLMDHMSDPETRSRYNLIRRLPHIVTPTLVLWGSDDNINDVALGRQTHELIPGSELMILEGAKHFLPQEQPQEFSDAVIRFLTQ